MLTRSLLPRCRQHFLTGGIFDGMMTYILFWTCVAAPLAFRRRPVGRYVCVGVVSSPLTPTRAAVRRLSYNVVHLF